jgi:hypothetical protein
MELVKGEFFEVSGINCSIENPSFVTAVISAAQFRFSRPWGHNAFTAISYPGEGAKSQPTG